MAGLVFWPRGNIHCVKRFLNELSAKYLRYTYLDAKDGKFIEGTSKDYDVSVAVRLLPLGAIEVVWPEKYTDIMLTTIMGKKPESPDKVFHGWTKKYIYPLRKIMKLKKIPDYDDKAFFPIFKEGVHIIPIGLHIDNINKEGHEEL